MSMPRMADALAYLRRLAVARVDEGHSPSRGTARNARTSFTILSMSDAPLRIAMWSGPRNISTAMMRSWGNRPNTFVCDEPLYPHYLSITRRAHPGAAEVLATAATDLQEAIDF